MDSESCFLGGIFGGGSPSAKLPLSTAAAQVIWRLHLKLSWLFEETEHPFTLFHFNGLTSAEFFGNPLDSTAKKKIQTLAITEQSDFCLREWNLPLIIRGASNCSEGAPGHFEQLPVCVWGKHAASVCLTGRFEEGFFEVLFQNFHWKKNQSVWMWTRQKNTGSTRLVADAKYGHKSLSLRFCSTSLLLWFGATPESSQSCFLSC